MPKALPVVRVFVSSTFRDMESERDELAKRAVPQLRQLCEERGVVWSEVDLRWGVTEAQAQRGETLPVCLAEIDRCRPYFICVLGEQYGWTDYELSPEVMERYPWLRNYAGASITELEVIHAALRDPDAAHRVWFYFKRRVPAARSRPSAGREPPESRRNLASLKRRIRATGLPWRRYSTPRDLAQSVIEDLTRAIDLDFPPGHTIDTMEREARAQEAYAASQAVAYVRRDEYFPALDAGARQGDGRLAVVGPAGSGKSALLANWSTHLTDVFPDALICRHFVGVTPASSEWAAMLKRLVRELCCAVGSNREIPDQSFALRFCFSEMLTATAQRSNVLLIIDGLDHLEDRDGARELTWLPKSIPRNVRIIVSAREGSTLEVLQKMGFAEFRIAGLTRLERAKLIIKRLRVFGKRLDRLHLRKLVESEHTGNPLFLRTILDELRVTGTFPSLGTRIDECLSHQSLDALYATLLARYERDYGRERPGLVEDALPVIWAAKNGVSEKELLEILGRKGKPMPVAYWSPLILATADALQASSGLLGFANPYFRAAVERRYLPDAKARREAHRRFATFLSTSALKKRKCEELLWQLSEAEDWRGLARALGDLEFISVIGEGDLGALLMAWRKLEAATNHRMEVSYRQVIEDPGAHEECSATVSNMLLGAGRHSELVQMAAGELEARRKGGSAYLIAEASDKLANAQVARGNLDEALKNVVAAEKFWRESGYSRGLLGSLTIKCGILLNHGRLAEALETSLKAERIAQELGNIEALTDSLSNKSVVLKLLGRIAESLQAIEEAEKLAHDLWDPIRIILALANRASLLLVRDPTGTEALQVLRKSEQLARDHGIPRELATILNNESVYLRLTGSVQKASDVLDEAERIASELRNQELICTGMMNRAQIFKARGDLESAFEMFGRAGDLWTEARLPKGVCKCLSNQAELFEETGQPETALEFRLQEEAVCRQAGFRMDLAHCLIKQAELLAIPLGRPLEAAKVLESALRAEGLEDWPEIAAYSRRVQRSLGVALMFPD